MRTNSKIIKKIIYCLVISSAMLAFISCASKDVRLIPPHDVYLYTTSDKRVMVYYNIFATRMDFTIKNITDLAFGDFKIETKCSMKGGFIAENFELGEIKQYFSKTFYAKIIHRDCNMVTLDYSYVPLEEIANIRSRRSSEDTYSTLPLSKRISGTIVIKKYGKPLAN